MQVGIKMNSKVKIKNLDFSYKEQGSQLKNINLEIESGKCMVLIGKSGCGKSSLTRTINGLIPNFYHGTINGKVFLDGIDIRRLKSWELGKYTGNVFQDPRSQFFANEVGGEIAFGCENAGLSHEEINYRVHKSAKDMEIENILETSIYTLSYGMRQKVAIAAAKAMEPDVYIFDEPSANLDVASTRLFAQILKGLKESGKSIIIAEHRLYYLNGIADQYVLMKQGKIERYFTQQEIDALSELDLNQIGLRTPELEALKRNKVANIVKKEHSLKVSNITKTIQNKTILHNINFSFYAQEIIALIGNNGAGKSTFGKILAGVAKETSGNVMLREKILKAKKRRGYIWYIPQDLDSQLFGESLLDELLTGLKPEESLKKKAEQILVDLDLRELKDRHPSTLSGGQKQRLALGVAMMYDAEIIILDEPTSGLDGSNMLRVGAILRKMNEQGTKFIIISHDVEFIMNTCDRVIKMEQGQITEDYFIRSSVELLHSMEVV